MHTQKQSATVANISGASLPSLRQWVGITPDWRLSLIGFDMQHYQFHVGDYLKATAHLEPLEDLTYRRLMDMYYDLESPLPVDTNRLARLVRMPESLVIAILGEFFVLQADGWHNKRCDLEIQRLYEKSDKARESAKKRWEYKGNANAMRTHSEGNAKGMLPITHNPLPITQSTTASKNPEANTDFEYAWKKYPKRAGSNPKGRALKAWNARIKEGETAIALTAGMNRYSAFIAVTGKEGTEYVMQAATFFGPDKHFLEAWERPQDGKKAEWWASDKATEEKGAEVGLKPRSGESWNDFRGRIRERLGSH